MTERNVRPSNITNPSSNLPQGIRQAPFAVKPDETGVRETEMDDTHVSSSGGSEPPLVRVRYLDHLLFRNLDPEGLRPVLRETVGWLVRDDPEAILIIWDRATEKAPQWRLEDPASGLVILRGDVVEMERIEG